MIRPSVYPISLVLLMLLTYACGDTHVSPISGDTDGGGGGVDVRGDHDECGNGMDDDGDGEIDEGCFCGPSESQACFNGTYPTRRIGACADGVQACEVEGSVEFGTWGACGGDTLPAEEVCDGAVDEDCDGAVDEGCPCTAGQTQECGVEFLIAPCTGGTQTCSADGTWSACEGAIGPSAETCDDGIDNDCDGDLDEGCGCTPEPEVCGDGVDNDCDGDLDEGCGCVPGPEVCGDGVDNDCDGMVDESSDCGPACPVGSPDIVDIDGSVYNYCARYRDGRLYCWGSNMFGGMGIGSETPEYLATPRLIVEGVDQHAVGADNATCVLRSGVISCWGRQPGASRGSMGYRNVEWSPFEPTQFVGVTGIEELRVGLDQYMIRLSDGTIHGWGYDGGGALGDGTAIPAVFGGLQQALYIDDAVDLDAFVRTVCAVRADGTVWCWGGGEEGQAGPPGGLGFRQHEPTHITGVSDARSVEIGRSHGCALRATGEVVCWGMDGTRGDGSPFAGDANFTTSAGPVPGISDAVQLEVGSFSNCIINTTGELWCWGMYNTWTAPEWEMAHRVTDVGEVVDVAMGGVVGTALSSLNGGMCVLERCGRVRCWGRNNFGMVGDGTTNEALTPVDVIGLP